MIVTFIIDREAANQWYYKNHSPMSVYSTAESVNAAQDELYRFAKENGFRARRHYRNRSNSSFWIVEEQEYNLLRLIYGDMFKSIKVSASDWAALQSG